MAGMVSLKTIGNWNKEIGVPLRDALAVSMDITGRTGEQACKHALILMAQSARSITKQAKKNRRQHRDKHGKYVEVWDKSTMTKLYEWAFSDDNPNRTEGTWDNARKVGSRGLAKRSWMWGLTRLGARKTGKQISGTSKVRTITSAKVNGYIKENRLDYITKVMPPGWEQEVVRRAGNKIMAQARNKLQNKWRKAMNMPRGAKISNENLSRFFLKV